VTPGDLWAPAAGAVELEDAGTLVPLERGQRGWWRGPLPRGDYRYRLDGTPLPDPRSPWQPLGVHGPSRPLDTEPFPWTDGGWTAPALGDCAIYELHIGTFSEEGTFDGAIAHLDDLVELGVQAVEVMPVAEFAGDRGWGYDGVDLYAPHHAYGGPAGLMRLVDACHRRGLAAILDVVYNHLGPEGNYLGRFGSYFTDSYPSPWGQAVNLDGPDSQPVRDYLIENAIRWLRDYHLDGLRLDAVHALYDHSAVHLLEEMAERVGREVGPDRWLIAESDLNDPRLATPVAIGGYGLTAHWEDDFHHAVHALLTGERDGYYEDFGSVEQLARALRRAYVYEGDYSRHRRRRHGRPHLLEGEQLVVCVQNHDQVGNRARGDRLCHLVSPGRARIAAALLLLSPFVPLLFMGEEWAASSPFPFFSSHTDPGIAGATTRGRIQEFTAFGWRPEDVLDPQSPATFEAARLRWSERAGEEHLEMLAWYRALLGLRRRHPTLRAGRLDEVGVEHGEDWLVLCRGGFALGCNWAADARSLPVRGEVVAASDPACRLAGDGLLLPGETAAVLRIDGP
jgi:maltooligosyltrehalose trehalohydrolase